jgi:formimidoylglutamate deiminase
MTRAAIIEADLTWVDGSFQRGVKVRVDQEGNIAEVGSLAEPATLRLVGRALLPGFVNAHSHAFQRALRGHGEKFRSGAGSFWSWREAMYSLVERVSPDEVYELCLRAYGEMMRAGITTVGEFHYLHHSPQAIEGSSRDFAVDEAVIRAGADSGIRQVLLFTYYRTGGIDKPLKPAQQRFETRTPGEFWKALESAAAKLDASRQSIGAVAHSIRAATPDEVADLYREARHRGLVFHMHVEEQQLELLDAEVAYGQQPMRLLLDRLDSLEGFTAVHCTHSASDSLQEFMRRGGMACITPLTEANLGDGIPYAEVMKSALDHLTLGTDSNARISMLEEMRWLEYAQRLRYEARGILADRDGSIARPLVEIATVGGARSLGVKGGSIAAGHLADFCSIDLTAPALQGAPTEWREDALVFGCGDDVIAGVCIGGRWIQR